MEYPRYKNTEASKKWLEENNPYPANTVKHYDFAIAYWDYMIATGIGQQTKRRLFIFYGVLLAVYAILMTLALVFG